MSCYDSQFETEFKRKFSRSYASFDDSELIELGGNIIRNLIDASSVDDEIVIQNLMKSILDMPPEYFEQSQLKYLKSKIIVRLFELSKSLKSYSDRERRKSAAFFIRRAEYIRIKISSYAKKENIPVEFAKLAKKSDCIKVLTGFFFKRCLVIPFDGKVINEAEDLINKWIKNASFETPYEKTRHFQIFLHEICIRKNGVDSELNLPPDLMRVILSTSRLHFSYMDEMNESLYYLGRVINKCTIAANNELKVINYGFSPEYLVSEENGKKFIKNWKVRHLKPIFSFEEFDDFMDILLYLRGLDLNGRYFDVILVLIAGNFMGLNDLQGKL